VTQTRNLRFVGREKGGRMAALLIRRVVIASARSDSAPPPADTKGVSSVHFGQPEENDGVDDMIIKEGMVLRRQCSEEHQHEHEGSEVGTQFDGKAESEG